MANKKCCRCVPKNGCDYNMCNERSNSYPHCWSWLWILPACIIIGFTCLAIGNQQKIDVNDNNDQVMAIYDSSTIVLHNKTLAQYIKPSPCAAAGESVNQTIIPECNSLDVTTTVKTCKMQGSCADEVCDNPCYFECKTNKCNTKQPKCFNELVTELKCNVHYDSVGTTYACVISPESKEETCQKECNDFSCNSAPGKCYCLCRKYAINTCSIRKYAIVTHNSFFYTEKGRYDLKKDVVDCVTTDTKCMNKLNDLMDMTYPEANIYYSSANPSDNVPSLDSKLQSISSKTNGLIVAGGFFTAVFLAVFLYEMWAIFTARFKIEVNCPKRKVKECLVCKVLVNKGELPFYTFQCGHYLHVKCNSKPDNLNCPACPPIAIVSTV
jgi:hypothetical protein